MRNLLIISSLCGLLMACQHSPQKNYYYLTATLAPKTAAPNSSVPVANLIGIGPIELAEYLNRLQIIEDQFNSQLHISSHNYWAEPLDKSIARVTALNLSSLKASRGFVYFPWRMDNTPPLSIRIHVHQLSRQANQVSMNASWEIFNNTTKTVQLQRHFIHSLQSENGAKGLAEAYSSLFAALAIEIDLALNAQ
jgi:uncharacterized protein